MGNPVYLNIPEKKMRGLEDLTLVDYVWKTRARLKLSHILGHQGRLRTPRKSLLSSLHSLTVTQQR